MFAKTLKILFCLPAFLLCLTCAPVHAQDIVVVKAPPGPAEKEKLLNTATSYLGFLWINTRSRADRCRVMTGVDITPFTDAFKAAHAVEDKAARDIIDRYWDDVYPGEKVENPMQMMWEGVEEDLHRTVKRDMDNMQRNRGATLEQLCNWYNSESETLIDLIHFKNRKPEADKTLRDYAEGME